ncbi:MAG TPA: glycoside hydrolase family 3 N-terminal domain-containing protein [Saprospiraceae bacterium]|nr:glycoside hydrolase family 3 N-terminal domain-containing protein [Saprospiraceae bacterium]
MLSEKVKTYTKLAGRNDETLHQINLVKEMQTQLNQTWRPRRLNLILAITAVAGFLMAAGLPQYPSTGLKAGQNPDEDRWVDSMFNVLTPDERLGQLFMIRAHSDKGADHIAGVEKLIREYHVGALCFFQGTPVKQVELTNRYQALTRHIPLMVAIDGEWGLGMRLKENTISYPRQLPLGAIQDNWLIYEFGKEVARQCRRIGIHVNFAPVADVNNNAANPVINTRSFGEDRYNVAVKSNMYAKGMQDNGVMACAKHFPGHGDTDVDSHLDLPSITHDRARLDSIELFPFRELARQGVGSFMIAHLNVPALDTGMNRPTTLSRYTVTELLRKEMGFEGLAFTDALEMKGVTKHFKPGEVEAEALLAGNDMLVLPESMEAAFREIKRYIAEGRIAQAEVNEHVKRVLRAKYRLGLTTFAPISTDSLDQQLNSPDAIALKWKLYEHSLTLARNKGNLLPIKKMSTDMAALSIGASAKSKFQARLESYKKMPLFQSPKEISSSERSRLLQTLGKKELVIVSLHGMSSFASQGYGLSKSALDFLETLARRTQVVLVVFGTPYSLRHFDQIDPVLVAYEDDPIAQDLAAQALFGAIGISGRLPVTASPLSKFNTGVTTSPVFKMGYNLPERVGMSTAAFEKMDRLAQEDIAVGATPGCVVLAAKDGQIVYHKAFGHHTYSKTQATQADDVYDLASVTKIAGGTLALMKLYDDGLVDLETPIVKYLPELAGSNKADLLLRDILAHRAGLQPWLPFYRKTVEKTPEEVVVKDHYYCPDAIDEYDIPVASNLYLRRDYADSVWQEIIASPLLPTRGYRYSDLGFYIVARMVHRLSGKTLDAYLEDNFFCPMGLESIGYNPWQRVELSRIAPTEYDAYFRMQKIQGYVHDMGAAMLGGVSGHAGLFANAEDLAAVLQMLLNYGYYGGQRYLDPATVKTFAARHPASTRRGMGFDMRQMDARMHQNVTTRMSNEAFGHDGFTGTSAWADPETGTIFILLSNRTYPSQKNSKLSSQRFRQRMQSVVYQSLKAAPDAEEWAQAKIPPMEDGGIEEGNQ